MSQQQQSKNGSWIVRNTKREKDRECDSEEEAKDAKNDMISLGADPSHLEIIPPVETPENGDNTTATEPTSEPEDTEVDTVDPVETPTTIPDQKPQVEQDPVDWLPDHFTDKIQGVPTVNRKGYAVLASQYNVSVVAKPITLASDTDFQHAEFRAVATTEDGKEYSGFGSARVERDDDPNLLNELAETRALKRATAWATGIGITAIEELQGGMDGR